ncbi:hypothetical protein HHI36_003499 [Cryptolaemus montrouzieri]|uniref:TIMELESS-interacting protein n=1 Tax=Cryptolaemus montrouzieri TaxID=559131 RepID=A0ABD2PEI5_9CUCU
MDENLSDTEAQDELELLENRDDLEEVENEPVEADPDDQNEDDEKEKKPVKAKRIIRNPRFTLNAELLKGPKGLGALERCFDKVKFKGKGHEEDDLNVLLKTYEYWCHRLYPKFPFQECIEKIEKLGSKGPIQTHLKKIRSGIIDDDQPSREVLPDFHSDEEENEESEATEPTTQTILPDIPIELTEEQLETIRKNREKAEKLRQERLKKIQEKASLILPESFRSGTSTVVENDVGEEQNELQGSNSEENGTESDEEVLNHSKKQSRKYFDSDEESTNSGGGIEKEREVENSSVDAEKDNFNNQLGNEEEEVSNNSAVTMQIDNVENQENIQCSEENMDVETIE